MVWLMVWIAMSVLEYQNLLEQCFWACEKVLGNQTVKCTSCTSLQLKAKCDCGIQDCIIMISLHENPWGKLMYETTNQQTHIQNFGTAEGLEAILWDVFPLGERKIPSVQRLNTGVIGTCPGA
jgi:hypothetical protein